MSPRNALPCPSLPTDSGRVHRLPRAQGRWSRRTPALLGLAALLPGAFSLAPSEGESSRTVLLIDGDDFARQTLTSILEADGSTATVYTLTDDGRRARRLPVTVGFIQGERVAVSGGLDGVSSVVTDGAAYLGDGAAVKVVP